MESQGPACGPGTGLSDGACVRDAIAVLVCGEGTQARDGQCVSSGATCGNGTHIEGGVCVLDQVGAQCGEGTVAVQGQCVTVGTVVCGPGTRQVGSSCELDSVPVICGPDVHAEDGTCVADGLGLACDPRVDRIDHECVGGDGVAPCGADTHPFNRECRADGRAIPDGSFSLSGEWSATVADGYTLFKLAALGRGDDGRAATDRVVVRTNRPGAGLFQVAEASLSALGRPFWFRPCSYADEPSCAGPIIFELARASEPAVVLARSQPVELTVPDEVPWFERCDRPGNSLWVQGDPGHGIVDGTRLVTDEDGQFYGFSTGEAQRQDRVGVYVDAGDWNWNVAFDTARLGGPPRAQVYPRVEGPEPSVNTPALLLSSPQDSCQIVDAQVQVRQLGQVIERGNNRTARLAMSFVAECVWPEWGRVVGCINYTAPGALEQP